VRILFRCKISIVPSGNMKIWMARPKTGYHPLQDVVRGAKEKRSKSLPIAQAQYLLEEIDARHTLMRLRTQQASAPQDPHAIYSNDIALDDVAPKLRLPSHLYELGYVERDMLATLPAAHGFIRKVNRFMQRQYVDWHAQELFPHPKLHYPSNSRELRRRK
jgi:hypothetical protein